jgi:hypothetical protein
MASACHIASLSTVKPTAGRGTENTGVVEITKQSRDQPRVNFMLAYALKKVFGNGRCWTCSERFPRTSLEYALGWE